MKTSALSDAIGVELHDVDPRQPLDDGQVAELRELYARHDLILVRGHELTREEYARFVGYLWPYATKPDGSPAWTAVSNVDAADGTGRGVLLFHQDEAFAPKPARALALYANQASPESSPTSFVSGVAAIELLSPELRERLATATARHIVDFRCIDGDSTYRVREVDLEPDAPLDRYPRHDHPVFYPVDGDESRRSLFVSEHQTSHLLDLSLEESERILQECFASMYVESNRYVHHWEPHDVLVWNNLALQHGRPSQVVGGPRDFWRLKTY